MEAKPRNLVLQLAALFCGGVAGGLLGGVLFSRPVTQPAESAAGPGPGPAAETVDPQLAQAIAALANEVRRLRWAPAEAGGGERRPVGESGAPAQDGQRMVAALERLTRALELAQGRAAPGGIGITPLVLPPAGSRQAALEGLVGRDWEEISREYRFWTFQQVLDRFGRPDEVDNDRWLYKLQRGDSEEVFSFQFSQGYLMNIYD